MSEFQRIIKYCAMAFAAFLAFTIISGILTGILALTGVISGMDGGNSTSINQSFDNVTSLYVEPGVGTLKMKVGESEQVVVIAENVSENFVVEQKNNGKLVLKGKVNIWNIFGNHFNNKKGDITIYLPSDFEAEKVELNAGTGNINIEELTTEMLDIDAGTGNITGSNITAHKVDIDGGVGDIDLDEVNLSNADIDCGVGKVSLQGSLTGKNQIDCGVGEVDLSLEDSADNYDIRVDKGLGDITINGEKYSDLKWNNKKADNSLDIDGGVGDIDIDFE